jgi:hypothetical protein
MLSHKTRRQIAEERMNEMRGRSHEKSQDQWAAYFQVSRSQIQKFLKELGEVARGGSKNNRKPASPWIEKFSKDDLWKIEQAKKPWGNYEKARKLWKSYMEEPGYEYLSRR